MTKTRTEMKQAYDDQGYTPPSGYRREPAREESVKDRLVRLQANQPKDEIIHHDSRGRLHDPFGHLRLSAGGWVAPLSPAQFAGSPQADTGTDAGTGDSGSTGGGDGGSV